MIIVEILPKCYHPYGTLGIGGLIGRNGKRIEGTIGETRIYWGIFLWFI